MHDIFSPYFFSARIFFWYLPNPPLKNLMVRPLAFPMRVLWLVVIDLSNVTHATVLTVIVSPIENFV